MNIYYRILLIQIPSDLLFIMDSTGSMGSYLDNATKNVIDICQSIIHSQKLIGESALRLGLISYRVGVTACLNAFSPLPGQQTTGLHV